MGRAVPFIRCGNFGNSDACAGLFYKWGVGVTEQGLMGTVACQRSEGQCLVFGSKVRLFICV